MIVSLLKNNSNYTHLPIHRRINAKSRCEQDFKRPLWQLNIIFGNELFTELKENAFQILTTTNLKNPIGS